MRYELDAAARVRFWAKVDRGAPRGCWAWAAVTDRQGYGLFAIGGGRSTRAHRLAFCLDGESIPAGAFVLHDCDNPPCVNPAHLYLGDHKANMRDRRERNRVARGEAVSGSKITAAIAAEIRAEWLALPRSQSGHIVKGCLSSLAARYGLHVNTIRLVGQRETWRHVA